MNIFAIRQLQVKCLEQRQDLYLFGDNSALNKFKQTANIAAVVPKSNLFQARVIENGDVSSPFPVTSGVKQGRGSDPLQSTVR